MDDTKMDNIKMCAGAPQTRYVSIGMWPEDYRHKLDVIVSHRTMRERVRQNRGVILGELIEKEYEKIKQNY